MTFADDVAIGLAQGRSLALERMDSVARIFYEGPRGPLVDGVQEPTEVDRIPSVRCRIHANADSANGTETSPGEALGSRLTRQVSIPVDSTGVQVGDFLELTTVGPMTDASLAGLRWRIIDAGQASQATARRMTVEVDR